MCIDGGASNVSGVEVDIIEERGRQLVESRGIDPGQKLLHVFVDPFEVKRKRERER